MARAIRVRPILGSRRWGRASRAAIGFLLPAIVAGLLTSAVEVAQASDPPNVLVILIDALRADHLGCYGYARNTSPVIDAVAQSGVVFENARSQASWTKPSIPSLFTGLYPIQHGVFTGTSEKAARIASDVLAEGHVTLAEVFKASAYHTGAFLDNVQISSTLGFAQGFDVYAEDLGTADNITQRAVEWLEATPASPFFAYVHYLDPHWPYTPPASYQEGHVRDAASVDFNSVNWKHFERQIRSGELVLTPEDILAMKRLYDGEIRFADWGIGRLLDLLRAQGRLENTIIVITADHGEEFLEHGNIGHGKSLYEEVLNVPLIIRAPGIESGRISALAQLIDVMPTILDLAGIPIPTGVAGRSLHKLTGGASMRPSPAFADHRPSGNRGRLMQSIRDGQFKLIRTYEMRGGAVAVERPWIPPEIEAGDWLEIDVVRLDGGRLLALEIEPQEAMTELRISGPVTGLDPANSQFRVLDLPCRLVKGAKIRDEADKRVKSDQMREGVWVQVKGTWSEIGVLQVRRVKLLDEPKREIKAPVLGIERTFGGMIIHLRELIVEVDYETDFEGEWPNWETEQSEASSSLEAAPAQAPERVLENVQLFDLATDPAERENISEQRQDLVRQLFLRLDQWEQAYAGGAEAPQIELDEEALERLRSLGYIR